MLIYQKVFLLKIILLFCFQWYMFGTWMRIFVVWWKKCVSFLLFCVTWASILLLQEHEICVRKVIFDVSTEERIQIRGLLALIEIIKCSYLKYKRLRMTSPFVAFDWAGKCQCVAIFFIWLNIRKLYTCANFGEFGSRGGWKILRGILVGEKYAEFSNYNSNNDDDNDDLNYT